MVEKLLNNNKIKFLREEEAQDKVLLINGKLKEVKLENYINEEKPEYLISDVPVNDKSIERYRKLIENYNLKIIWKITDRNSDNILLDSFGNFEDFSSKAKEKQQQISGINQQTMLINKIQTEKKWMTQDKVEVSETSKSRK